MHTRGKQPHASTHLHVSAFAIPPPFLHLHQHLVQLQGNGVHAPTLGVQLLGGRAALVMLLAKRFVQRVDHVDCVEIRIELVVLCNDDC